MHALIDLSKESEPNAYISCTLPWVFEAGNPYYERFFDGCEHAERFLTTWMKNPRSEISLTRVFLLQVEAGVAGGFIGVPGAEVAGCRQADTLALVKQSTSSERKAFLAKLEQMKSLFPEVDAQSFYLSKIGVLRDFRGHGHGKILLDYFLEEGRQKGFKRFWLEVNVQNDSAISLYKTRGFQIVEKRSDRNGALNYYTMIL